MRLGDAHQAFEALKVEKFDETDVVGGGRTILLDQNWVVIAQRPAAGTSPVDEDATIALDVGKVDDETILSRIPDSSPVAVELRAQRVKEQADAATAEAKAKAEALAKSQQEAADAKKEQAERLASAREYAARVAKVAAGFDGVLKLYDVNAASVVKSGGGVVAAKNALAAKNFYEVTSDELIRLTPPDGLDLNGVQTDMALAAATMVDACDALVVAIDSNAPSAIASADLNRDSARAQWAKAMARVFGAAQQPSPALSP